MCYVIITMYEDQRANLGRLEQEAYYRAWGDAGNGRILKIVLSDQDRNFKSYEDGIYYVITAYFV